MLRPHSLVAGVSLWMARIGGTMLIAASFIISFEILARKLLFLPFNIGTELSTYALAVGASWSFSYALLHRAHVRIDVLRNGLGPVAKAALDVLSLISLTVSALVLAWYVYDTVEASWSLGARENTSLGTPLIIPHGLWFVGLVWFAIVCVEQLATVLTDLARGDTAAVVRRAGPAGVDEELEEVLARVESHRERVV
jgi:TRAP-type mannitol/chloroaromatic compound transport system permease small subunit